MTTLVDLRPGDIGFTSISGNVGKGIAFAQWALAHTVDEERDIQHVFVVVQAAEPDPQFSLTSFISGARIVQAMPHGAGEIEIGQEHTGRAFVYLRPPYMQDGTGLRRSERVARAARGYVGTPYSFADYAAILGLHMGIKNGLIRRRVTSSGHMICSQLADQAMTDAGWHNFSDGRLPQDVMPAELYRALRAMPGTQTLRLA